MTDSVVQHPIMRLLDNFWCFRRFLNCLLMVPHASDMDSWILVLLFCQNALVLLATLHCWTWIDLFTMLLHSNILSLPTAGCCAVQWAMWKGGGLTSRGRPNSSQNYLLLGFLLPIRPCPKAPLVMKQLLPPIFLFHFSPWLEFLFKLL